MRTAKEFFELHLRGLRDMASKYNLAFVDVLAATIKNPRSKQIVLADALVDPLVLEKKLIERYRVEFYEWLANTFHELHQELVIEYYKQRESRKEGGKKRAEQRQSESAEKAARILSEEAKLVAQGVENGLNKRIASTLKLDYDYVRKVRRARNKTRKPDAS